MVSLSEKIRNLPDHPGVYLFKDAKGKVLYIGKALSLRKRVPSHFRDSPSYSERIAALISQIADLDFILTDSELEALILESNLIKERRPKYNVVLRDDKHYPFLKLDPKEPFPRVSVARRIKDDGALYYGPYVPAGTMWDTLFLINKAFPLRKCKSLKGRKLCLDYHLGRCLGPCEGLVSPEEYGEVVKRVRLILEGRDRELVKLLERQMRETAERLEFERAAQLRDQVQALKQTIEGQKIISAKGEDQDVLGFAQKGKEGCVQLFVIRGGRLIGRESFAFEEVAEKGKAAFLSSFIKQLYLAKTSLPKEVLIPFPVEDQGLIEEWLSARAGRKVSLTVPQRGKRAELVEMAMHNAEEMLNQSLRSSEGRERALQELREFLGMSRLPRRIEAYDISNISGNLAVGSLVVFADGAPKRSDYRRYRIKTVLGADDYAMLREVLGRRFRRQEEMPLPDIILIDGGRGQLNAALKVAQDLHISRVTMISLAKEDEEVFHPSQIRPLPIPAGSRAKHLLQQIRDESHRFALAYHRKLRGRSQLHSILDEIPGIGERRRRILLTHFGSLERLQEASVEDLRRVGRIPAPLAQAVHDYLRAYSP
ncbi:MAG: excinuclease ABC subunit UvrC [candidate division NC10 bacterium]|nr:excinuclease ABC subunit UvrC [candidate division NC10 bacterium]